MEATKDIYGAKCESTLDHNTWYFKKFYSEYKNLDDQAKLGRPKTMDSGAMLQAIEVNLSFSTQRVLSKLSIS